METFSAEAASLLAAVVTAAAALVTTPADSEVALVDLWALALGVFGAVAGATEAAVPAVVAAAWEEFEFALALGALGTGAVVVGADAVATTADVAAGDAVVLAVAAEAPLAGALVIA